MMEIRGRLKGEKAVARMYAAAPHIYLRFLIAWLKDERAGMVGGKDSRGKKRKGYRDILAGRRRKKRGGTWSRSVTSQFKGYLGGLSKIQNLRLVMGAGLAHPHQITRALEMLGTGGTITSGKMMPVPVYKNLERIGITRGFHKAKVFKRLMRKGQLGTVEAGDQMLFFDKDARKKRGVGYKRRGLLFIGTHSITVGKALTGRYDFFARWDRRITPAISRGQGVIDRATVRAEKGID